MLAGAALSDVGSRREFATGKPSWRSMAVVVYLLMVTAMQSTPPVWYGTPTMSRYPCRRPSSPGVPWMAINAASKRSMPWPRSARKAPRSKGRVVPSARSQRQVSCATVTYTGAYRAGSMASSMVRALCMLITDSPVYPPRRMAMKGRRMPRRWGPGADHWRGGPLRSVNGPMWEVGHATPFYLSTPRGPALLHLPPMRLLKTLLHVLVAGALVLAGWIWLRSYTRHSEHVRVPAHRGLSIQEASELLAQRQLHALVI